MRRVARERRSNQPEKKYWCKIFQTRYDLVGAICDKEILGKEIENKEFKIKVNKQFYGGVLISERAAINIMNKVTIGNIIGKEIIAVAKQNGFITGENIILIGDVPHAQFVKL